MVVAVFTLTALPCDCLFDGQGTLCSIKRCDTVFLLETNLKQYESLLDNSSFISQSFTGDLAYMLIHSKESFFSSETVI